ncbi:hypothetical protein HK102_003996, partial [Quaeritorhiza haematococci]
MLLVNRSCARTAAAAAAITTTGATTVALATVSPFILTGRTSVSLRRRSCLPSSSLPTILLFTHSSSRSLSSKPEYSPPQSKSPETDDPELEERLQKVLGRFSSPVRYAFAYGSGVFRQSGYERLGRSANGK